MCVCVLGHLPMLERAASNDEYVSVWGGGALSCAGASSE